MEISVAIIENNNFQHKRKVVHIVRLNENPVDLNLSSKLSV